MWNLQRYPYASRDNIENALFDLNRTNDDIQINMQETMNRISIAKEQKQGQKILGFIDQSAPGTQKDSRSETHKILQKEEIAKNPERIEKLNAARALQLSGGETTDLSEATKIWWSKNRKDKATEQHSMQSSVEPTSNRGNNETSDTEEIRATDEISRTDSIRAIRVTISNNRHHYIRNVLSRSDILRRTLTNMEQMLSNSSGNVTHLETPLDTFIGAIEDASRGNLDRLQAIGDHIGRNPFDSTLDRMNEDPENNIDTNLEKTLNALQKANE